MSTTDYALIISLFSAVVSIGALLWNVWQKFIFVKPALQVSFRISRVFKPTGEGTVARTDIRLLHLSVTNLGPGPAIIYLCNAKIKSRWWKRTRYATLNPIHGNPLHPEPVGIGPIAGGLPAKVDAGELQAFYFPYQKDCFLEENVARVGLNDTYQRNIWCSRKDLRKVRTAYRRDFGAGSAVAADQR